MSEVVGNGQVGYCGWELPTIILPFATNNHMVQNPSYWRASLLLFPHWEIQNKETSSLTGQTRFVLKAVAFFCPPVWWILYHLIVCCKRPITQF